MHLRQSLIAIATLLCLNAQAAEIEALNNSNWLVSAAWAGGAVPGPNDIAVWKGSSSTSNMAIGSGSITAGNNGTRSQAVGAIVANTTRTRGTTYGNATTTGDWTLTLNGSTYRGVEHVVLANDGTSDVTFNNKIVLGNKKLNLELASSTDNVVLLGGLGNLNLNTAIAGAGKHLTLNTSDTLVASSTDVAVTFNSNNTWDGGMTINGNRASSLSSAVFLGTGSLPTSGNLEVNGYSRLAFASAGDWGSASQVLTLNSTASVLSRSALSNVAAGNSNWLGQTVLQRDSTVYGLNGLGLKGSVSGAGALTTIGNVALTAVNSWTGGTRVLMGNIDVANGSSLSTGDLHLTQVESGNGTSSSVTLNNAAQSVGNLSNAWLDTSGAATQKITLNGTPLTVNQSSNGSFGNGVVATLAGFIEGTGSLIKQGLATLTLSGANTYTGATVVNEGILSVTGSLSGASQVTVNSAGTLAGSGTLAGDTIIYGTHTPGNSPGIQSFSSNLTYAGGGAVVDWELNDNTSTNAANPNAVFDQIEVGGNLDFADATTLNLSFTATGSAVLWSDNFWSSNHTGTNGWLLFEVVGTLTNFGNLHLNSSNWLDSAGSAFASAHPGGSFSLFQSGNSVFLNYTATAAAVPEPASALLMALGGLALMGRRRQARPAA